MFLKVHLQKFERKVCSLILLRHCGGNKSYDNYPCEPQVWSGNHRPPNTLEVVDGGLYTEIHKPRII